MSSVKIHPLLLDIGLRRSVLAVTFLLASGTTLRHFDVASLTDVHADGSRLGNGAVPVQRYQGAEYVMANGSRSLTKVECNYTVTEQEC